MSVSAVRQVAVEMAFLMSIWVQLRPWVRVSPLDHWHSDAGNSPEELSARWIHWTRELGWDPLGLPSRRSWYVSVYHARRLELNYIPQTCTSTNF